VRRAGRLALENMIPKSRYRLLDASAGDGRSEKIMLQQKSRATEKDW
jgi:hypothetical protein